MAQRVLSGEPGISVASQNQETAKGSRAFTHRSGWVYLSIIFAVVLAFAALAACTDSGNGEITDSTDDSTEEPNGTDDDENNDDAAVEENSEALDVVVTMPFMHSMVEAVGAEYVSIESIVPRGSDAHTYQPSPGDAQLIADADVIFSNGLGLEEFLDDLVESAGGVDTPQYELADGLQDAANDSDDHHHDDGHADDDHSDDHNDDDADNGDDDQHDHDYSDGNPHLWLDPSYAIHYVEHIHDGLADSDPSNASVYRDNADKFIEEIEAFDEWAQEEMAQIPDANRYLVTFHDAFPYFANHYDLEVIGVVVTSPGREPGAQEIAQLADEIRDVGVPAIFIEPQFNPSLAESIADEAGVEVHTIYSDTPPEDAGYLDMMELNVERVVEGLS